MINSKSHMYNYNQSISFLIQVYKRVERGEKLSILINDENDFFIQKREIKQNLLIQASHLQVLLAEWSERVF